MIEGRNQLRQLSALVILLAVVGCEGPMGHQEKKVHEELRGLQECKE